VPQAQAVKHWMSQKKHSYKNQTDWLVQPENTWTDGFSGFLKVTGPISKKLENLHKNYVFSQEYDPKT
jgi:hypothetical protein